MLKRKLKTNIDRLIDGKRKAEEQKLDILFNAETVRPTSVKECLTYIRGLVDWRVFGDKIPAVVLKSHLYSLFSDRTLIDNQINELRCQGHIIMIKLDTGTYGLVDKQDYLSIVRRQMEEEEISKDVGDAFINFCVKDELDVEINVQVLSGALQENQMTELVRAGYLTFDATGLYHLTIPYASQFLRALNGGLSYIKSVIKKSKFQEMPLMELLQRNGKKTKTLGMTYCCLALVGLEEVRTVATTTGPLLRYIEND